MDHTTRTIIFGVVAVVAVSMGFATSIWIEPKDPDKFSDEGEPFFPDFSDPFKARAIEVSVFNPASSVPETFRVEYKDGLWRIPSHFDYPADGADQLGKTAASVIGITRDSLESLSKDDHEAMGVVDPLDDKIVSADGRGTRVTLFDQEGEEPLVDYIIGKPAEGQRNRFYVRKADEDRTYLVNLEIDLSTKFADWVEPDLLDVERNDIVNIYIDDYSLVETTRADGAADLDIQEGETVRLHREPGGFQWTLDGLDAATETLKTGVVNAMLTALDDLKFIGVRPKPDFFEGVLRGELQVSSGDLSLIARSLQAKGYYLTQANADGNMGLFSKEGSLVAGTADGVSYQLLVGNVFVGTQNEIEIGGESESDETAEPVEEADAADDPAAEETEAPEEELAPGEQRSRYLFILTDFDEALLGPKPEPPVMPTPPGEPAEGATESAEGETETEEPEQSTDEEAATDAADATDPAIEAEAVEDDASDESTEATEDATESGTEAEAEAPQCDDPADADETAADDTAAETDAAAIDDPAAETEPTDETATDATAVDDPAATDDEAGEGEPAVDDAADTTDAEVEAPVVPTAEELQAAYETAMQEYEAAMRQYERDLEDYNERLEAGQKKVEELRERFANWYYVIPADVFDDLDVSRADLAGPKTEDAAGGPDGAPDFNLPGIPGLPEGHPEIPGFPIPEGADEEATDPMTETPEADAEASTEAGAATTEEEATEAESPEATPETPEAEGSQSSETDESPAAEPDSESEASTIEGEAATPE